MRASNLLRNNNPALIQSCINSCGTKVGDCLGITMLAIGIITLLGGAAVFGCGINGLVQPAYLTWVGLGSLIFGTLFTSYLLFDLTRLCSSSKKDLSTKKLAPQPRPAKLALKKDSPASKCPKVQTIHAFSYLKPKELCLVARVSKNWSHWSTANRLWAPILDQYWAAINKIWLPILKKQPALQLSERRKLKRIYVIVSGSCFGKNHTQKTVPHRVLKNDYVTPPGNIELFFSQSSSLPKATCTTLENNVRVFAVFDKTQKAWKPCSLGQMHEKAIQDPTTQDPTRMFTWKTGVVDFNERFVVAIHEKTVSLYPCAPNLKPSQATIFQPFALQNVRDVKLLDQQNILLIRSLKNNYDEVEQIVAWDIETRTRLTTMGLGKSALQYDLYGDHLFALEDLDNGGYCELRFKNIRDQSVPTSVSIGFRGFTAFDREKGLFYITAFDGLIQVYDLNQIGQPKITPWIINTHLGMASVYRLTIQGNVVVTEGGQKQVFWDCSNPHQWKYLSHQQNDRTEAFFVDNMRITPQSIIEYSPQAPALLPSS